MKSITLIVYSMKGGGAEKVAYLLCNHFVRKSIKVDLVLFSREEDYIELIDSRVKIHYLSRYIFRFGLAGKILSLWLRLIRLKPKVILSVAEWPNLLTPLVASCLFPKPSVFISEHNTRTFLNYPREYGLSNRIKKIARKAYNKSDGIIAVSEHVRDSVLESLNTNIERIVVINNPINISHVMEKSFEFIDHPFIKNKSGKLLIAAGRLTKHKDYATMIKAVSLLKEKVDVKLIILGDGNEKERLKVLIKDLNLTKIVDLAGFVSNPYKYFKNADLFVHSSWYEGFGMVFLEAMACGLKVVTTDCNIPKELFEKEDLERVVPIGDYINLSEKICEVLKEPLEKDKQANKVSKYDVSIVAEKYLQFITAQLEK